MKMKIADFFEMVRKEGGHYEVNTPQGWQGLGDLYIKRAKKCFLLRLESGKTLGCSSDHLVMTDSGWLQIDKINVQKNKVETVDGSENIVAIESLGVMDTYDWEVKSAEHAYYSNGVVSHNTGKTQAIRQFENHPVVFQGKEYKGYKVISVPLGQAEEMGDVLGMPARHLKVFKDNGKTRDQEWVPEQVVSSYMTDGWKIDHEAGVTTRYAPPGWVPHEDGPCILLLDDWNRANIRVIKGCMQLMQEYGTIGWMLPAGVHIVTTGNPANKDYLVSQLDSAMLTRMRHITLKADAFLWAEWADKAGLDKRGITFVLKHPELLIAGERTNPRSLSGLFRHTSMIGDISDKKNARMMEILANSQIDSTTAATMLVFMSKDMSMVTDPEDILSGKVDGDKVVTKLIGGKTPRQDILSVITDRMIIHIINRAEKLKKSEIDNLGNMLMSDSFPEDSRFAASHRLLHCEKKDLKYIIIGCGKKMTDKISEAMS